MPWALSLTSIVSLKLQLSIITISTAIAATTTTRFRLKCCAKPQLLVSRYVKRWLNFPCSSDMAGGEGHGQAVAGAQLGSKKKSAGMQQKRLELEDEVENLLKTLQHEEKVHRVLEGASMQTNAGCTLEIPNFLPKKVITSLSNCRPTKELLAELAMVEEEITRLEQEVSKIQQGLIDEKAPERSPKQPGEYKHIGEHINPPFITHRDSSQPDHAPVLEAMESKAKLITAETQPMFFINQAIKGDYNVHAFGGKTKSASFGGATEKKENPRIMSGFEAKATGKTGSLEKAVTLEPSTISLPSSKLLEHGHNMSFKSSKEPPVTSSSPRKSNIQLLQPNKVSERIMKCLICIFLRMMRTSRSMELEKSSLTAKSAHPSLNLRSFRLEKSSLNLKTSLTTQREAARQDPYGIFEIEGSILRDIGAYKNLVKFTSNSMDAKGLSSSMHLLRKLRILMSYLQQEVEPRFLTHQQKLAFWINVYNICIMNGFLEHGLPSNPEKVLALRNKAVLNIGGSKLNARAIEHSILRLPSNRQNHENWKGEKDEREDTVLRSIYGLEKPEPNIAFALCCGTKSSPAVRIYTADGVDSELEKAKLEYLQASIVVTADRKLLVPKLLLSDMHDLAGEKPPVEWICSQLPTSGTLRRSITECLRVQNRKSTTEMLDVMPYQYDFQYLFFM